MSRPYEHLEMRALSAELYSWGRWIEQHADYTGHSRINILAAYIGGAGGGLPGHRVLCLDMPIAIWATHHRVLRCTEDEQNALLLWYAVRMRGDGTLWDLAMKCLRVGISPRTLRRRVTRARAKILGVYQETDCRLLRVA